MIFKPEYFYTFLRIDEEKRIKTQNDKYPDYWEILSDSWGDSPDAKDRLLWDGDLNSADFWMGSDLYQELIDFLNIAIKEGYTISINETEKDPESKYHKEYIIKNEEIKL